MSILDGITSLMTIFCCVPATFRTVTLHSTVQPLPSRAVPVSVAEPSPIAFARPSSLTDTIRLFDDCHFTNLMRALSGFTSGHNCLSSPKAMNSDGESSVMLSTCTLSVQYSRRQLEMQVQSPPRNLVLLMPIVISSSSTISNSNTLI